MKNDLKFQGIVRKIYPIEIISSNGKTFKKQLITIEEDEADYPKSMTCEVFEKLELLNGIEVGDTVEAFINVRSKEFTKVDKVFVNNTISAWKFAKLASGQKVVPVSPPPPADDDLPF